MFNSFIKYPWSLASELNLSQVWWQRNQGVDRKNTGFKEKARQNLPVWLGRTRTYNQLSRDPFQLPITSPNRQQERVLFLQGWICHRHYLRPCHRFYPWEWSIGVLKHRTTGLSVSLPHCRSNQLSVSAEGMALEPSPANTSTSLCVSCPLCHVWGSLGCGGRLAQSSLSDSWWLLLLAYHLHLWFSSTSMLGSP